MSIFKDEHFNHNNVETLKQKIMKMTYYIYSLILYNIFKVIAKKKQKISTIASSAFKT